MPEELQKPKVSAIIAAYQAENYIRECIESLQKQTLRELEILVVDDGSEDATAEIAGKMAEEDPRIRVIRAEHAGAAPARNRGIQEAKGEFLIFPDADDYADETFVETLYRGCVDHDSDVAVAGCRERNEDTGEIYELDYPIKKEMLPENNPFSYTDIPDKIFLVFNGWAWDKMFRTSMVREHHLEFQNLRSTNDMCFVDLSYVCARRIYVDPTPLFNHRTRIKGSLSVTREKKWTCFYEALLNLRKELQDRGVYETVKKSYLMWAADFTCWNLRTLKGQTFRDAYAAMQNGIIRDLGILDMPEADYEGRYRDYYRKCAFVTEHDLLDALELVREERDKLQEELDRERFFHNCDLNALHGEQEAHRLLQEEVDMIISSKTFKIGDAIMRIPKLLKGTNNG